MLTNWFAGSFFALSLAVMGASAGGTAFRDCCEKGEACCPEGAPCCESPPACCQAGGECCEAGNACCE